MTFLLRGRYQIVFQSCCRLLQSGTFLLLVTFQPEMPILSCKDYTTSHLHDLTITDLTTTRSPIYMTAQLHDLTTIQPHNYTTSPSHNLTITRLKIIWPHSYATSQLHDLIITTEPCPNVSIIAVSSGLEELTDNLFDLSGFSMASSHIRDPTEYSRSWLFQKSTIAMDMPNPQVDLWSLDAAFPASSSNQTA